MFDATLFTYSSCLAECITSFRCHESNLAILLSITSYAALKKSEKTNRDARPTQLGLTTHCCTLIACFTPVSYYSYVGCEVVKKSRVFEQEL